eukprot:scaffold1525_cov142-Cylindrotheca_fusiformis.AAC.157
MKLLTVAAGRKKQSNTELTRENRVSVGTSSPVSQYKFYDNAIVWYQTCARNKFWFGWLQFGGLRYLWNAKCILEPPRNPSFCQRIHDEQLMLSPTKRNRTNQWWIINLKKCVRTKSTLACFARQCVFNPLFFTHCVP